MGEIGINRREYLYDLNYIDMLMIERGYERRHRHLWSATRWQTYFYMAVQCGTDKLREKGINGPADILPLPWDKEQKAPVSQETIDELQAEMREINAMNAKS